MRIVLAVFFLSLVIAAFATDAFASDFSSEPASNKFSDAEAEAIVSSVNSENGMNPVIIVPGLFGSQLEWRLKKAEHSPHFICKKDTHDSWDSFWIAVHDFLPLEIDCWLENMKLELQPNGVSTDRPGVTSRPRFWPSTKGVEYLDDVVGIEIIAQYAHNFLELLRKAGYEDGRDIFAHSFDFRHSPLNYYQPGGEFDDFYRLVEYSYKLNGAPAILVTHSMGSLHAVAALAQKDDAWKAKHIERLITAGAPYGGAPQMAGAMLNVKEFTLLPPWAKEKDFTPAAMTWCGVGWLAPDPELLSDPQQTLVTAHGKKYSYGEVEALMGDIKNGMMAQCYHQTRGLFTDKCPTKDCEPGVRTQVFYGKDIKTEKEYEITKGYGESFEHIEAKVVAYQPGDGTVPLDSSTTLPKRWMATGNNGKRIAMAEIPNCKHEDLLKGKVGAETIFKAMFTV
ncbi:Lecithin [Carpediemonas membranifera]|uniref:Lecithin n=1 Tax=Carpediemonas membranifera TaxID=201153 RepID=A0A8J6BZ24_9EUKA|nr:Lecithin [Carpediemonas membranifera]|eukprot:KAG9395121.1 Lecithin [Carpediemonas membranifera]